MDVFTYPYPNLRLMYVNDRGPGISLHLGIFMISSAGSIKYTVVLVYCSDVTWASQRLRSTATQPFVQHFVKGSNNVKDRSSASLAFCEGNPPVTKGPHID